jgi:hypothetical protein
MPATANYFKKLKLTCNSGVIKNPKIHIYPNPADFPSAGYEYIISDNPVSTITGL